MFGYSEPSHDVLKTHTHPSRHNPTVTQHYELRQEHGGRIPYIALFSLTPTGACVSDRLLHYGCADAAKQDWERLIGPAVVEMADLQHIEYIDNHHIGYTRDGGVCMC